MSRINRRKSRRHLASASDSDIEPKRKIGVTVRDLPVRSASNTLQNLFGTETILMVEPDTANRRLLALSLQSFGYKVISATDASSALDAWTREPNTVHVLLTQGALPGGTTGAALANRIRSCEPDLKLVFLPRFSEAELPELSGIPFSSCGGAQQVVELIRQSLDTPEHESVVNSGRACA
jgi:CheY-like chemotaxis protein